MRRFLPVICGVLVGLAFPLVQVNKAFADPKEGVWYKIVPKLNKVTKEAPKGFGLNVRDAKMVNGTPIVLCEDNDDDNQIFKVVHVERAGIRSCPR